MPGWRDRGGAEKGSQRQLHLLRDLELGGKHCRQRVSTKIPRWERTWFAKATAGAMGKEEWGRPESNGKPARGAPGR